MAIERRKDNKNRVLKEGENQRANGSYEYKWRDSTGKRRSIYAKTLDELREREKELTKNSLDGIRTANKNLIVNDLYNLWIQIKKGLKPNTFANYKYMYEAFVKDDLGKFKIIDLKRTYVRAFYNKLADEQNIKPSTIDCIHTVIHQVLQLAVEDDYLRYNPSDNALKELKRAHNSNDVKEKALTLEQQELFEDFLKNTPKYNRWYPIFTVMLWTGLRVGELTGLRWCDINFNDECISVNHTLVYFRQENGDGCKYSINTPKSLSSKRTIPMIPKVKEALLLEKEMQEQLNIKCNAVVDGVTGFVFVNRFGDTQNQNTLNKALRRIIRDCNYEVIDNGKTDIILPKFSNHSLRHTFTTRMCEAGVNIKVMQDVLGHADAQITMNIYAEATKDFKRLELYSLNNYFEN